MLPGAAGEQSLPNHFVEEGARIEMFGGREVLERFGEGLAFWFRWSGHSVARKITFVPRFAPRFARCRMWGGAAAPPYLV